MYVCYVTGSRATVLLRSLTPQTAETPLSLHNSTTPRAEHHGAPSWLTRSTHRLVLQVGVVALVPEAVGLDGEHRPHPHHLAVRVHLSPFVVQPLDNVRTNPWGHKTRKAGKTRSQHELVTSEQSVRDGMTLICLGRFPFIISTLIAVLYERKRAIDRFSALIDSRSLPANTDEL